MKPIYGEYECRLDAKGRFVLPSVLKKQLPDGEQKEFWINRGLDKCLVMYPVKIWERELNRIHSKNQYVAENRAFLRKFQSGATPVELDGNGRVLVPKKLTGHAELDKEVVLVAAFDRIEIWDKATFERYIDDDRWGSMESLAEKVMGDQAGGNED